MITISILASGPSKPSRNRHLEIFNGIPCISRVINNCQVEDVKISVIINNKNIELRKFLLENHKNIIILETKDLSMKTTYEVAFNQDTNDTLLVDGDLWNLKKENILKYLNSEYASALYSLKTPWGNNIISRDNSLIRRGDIGNSLCLIAQKHQKEYLSGDNINKAIYYFNQFYPNLNMKNIIFYSSWENNPEKLLNRYSKMTPSNLGIWNNLKGVTDINTADYIVFLEGIPNNFNLSLLKNIKDIFCFPREPLGDKNWEKLSLKYGYTFNNHYYVVTDPQFINKTYDELSFDYNKCDKLLSAVVSNKNLGPSYELRRNFFINLSTIYPDICDIYGAGWTNELGSSYKGSLGNYHNKNINNINNTSKFDALKNYKYTICIENCVRKNYFTEKFTDAILSGCIPIYFGCPNISDYFPNDCYYVIDINDINCYEKIMDIINKPVSEENISALKTAHELILNKYNIWSTVQNKIQNKIQFYSQYSQDKYIYNTFFKNKTNGTFVEIGADDGVRFSNCKFFEDYLGWNGIAIEARKDAYSKLIKNRGCLCVNAVLSDKEEETEFLDIKGYGIGLSGLINKYDKRHIERIHNEVKNPNNKGYDKIIVNTEKLSNILEKQNIYNIDFLSIDTEGSELDILKTLDFTKFNIDVITIEDNYNDRNIIDFFTKKGYELITIIECDKIFKKI